MGARRYGDGTPVAPDAYHQSKNELDGLPNTVTEKIPVTNTPNIFSYKSYVFAKNPASCVASSRPPRPTWVAWAATSWPPTR